VLSPAGWRTVLTLAAILSAMATVAGTHAAQPITYLGPPSNAKPPFVPLGSFRHTNIDPHVANKPQLVYLGTQIEDSSAIERWAVVKALDQFGRFSRIHTLLTRYCFLRSTPVNDQQLKVDCGVNANEVGRVGANGLGWSASFDLRRAHYTSEYVSFAGTELLDHDLKLTPPSALSRTQLLLFNRYVRVYGYSRWHDEVLFSAVNQNGNVPGSRPGHQFPLVAIGGYVETGANVAYASDLMTPDRLHYLSFTQIQRALQTGKTVGDAPGTLVPDVNAEANVITALICHTDGRKPAKACNRPVIRSILKHVK
jgi:hypothetical protein